MPLWMIILIVVAVIIGLAAAAYQYFNEHNNKCDKCGRNVSEVDDYYYFRRFASSGTRYRCSLHPLKGYSIRYIESKHYKKMLMTLSETNQEKLKNNGSLEVVLKDFGFAKIIRTYRKDQKNVSEDLSIDKRKLTLDDKKKGIYLITNKELGTRYVGQSINISNRWSQHITSGHEDGFHNKMLGHENDYTFEVLMNCPKQYLDFFEAYYIAHYNSYDEGYNSTKGNYSHLSDAQIKILNSMN